MRDELTGWRVGIDIGGTFTDIFARAPDGQVRQAKTLTTQEDPLSGLQNALVAIGLDWPQVAVLIHGTTLITNSLVEGRMARVVLITTSGFEDVLEIGRTSRDQLYDLAAQPRAAPVVARDRVAGAAERLNTAGEIVEALSGPEIERIGAFVAATKPDAVAISLLHAYANDAHEIQLAAALGRIVPYVSRSSQVSPEAREFERTTAACLNAAVMPGASRYLDRLESAVPESTTLRLFHSAGGMAPPRLMRDLPLALAQSGPAAGAYATADVCRSLGLAQAVGFDMGGTTTDVCLVVNGKLTIHSAAKLGGYPIRQPMVAIESVGAGGGSVVRCNAGGLTIGPDSAGASPGPACYGLGGMSPTITDINAIAGFLDPDRRLGGQIRVDAELARQAVKPIAAALGHTIDDTALGVLDIANAVMARALGRVTVQRGIDLRQSVLVAFGGAGPMHAASLARHVGIAKVIIPAASAAFSAYGCVAAEPMFARQKTLRLSSSAWNETAFATTMRDLDDAAAAGLAGISDGFVVGARVLLIRYVGQSVAVEVPHEAGDGIDAIGRRFREVHERVYGYATQEPFLIESARATARIPDAGAAPAMLPKPDSEGPPKPYRTSPCLFASGKVAATPWFDRAALPLGHMLVGPFIVADAWSTVVVPPDASCVADVDGHLHIEV